METNPPTSALEKWAAVRVRVVDPEATETPVRSVTHPYTPIPSARVSWTWQSVTLTRTDPPTRMPTERTLDALTLAMVTSEQRRTARPSSSDWRLSVLACWRVSPRTVAPTQLSTVSTRVGEAVEVQTRVAPAPSTVTPSMRSMTTGPDTR